MSSLQGTVEAIAPGVSIRHMHFQDADTVRWVPRYEFRHSGRVRIRNGIDDFETETEAMEKNRQDARRLIGAR